VDWAAEAPILCPGEEGCQHVGRTELSNLTVSGVQYDSIGRVGCLQGGTLVQLHGYPGGEVAAERMRAAWGRCHDETQWGWRWRVFPGAVLLGASLRKGSSNRLTSLL